MAKKRKPIEDWQAADARRLKELFKLKSPFTQEEFGHHYEIGSQGLVTQYLNGIIPLGHESAYKFAKALGCYISDFSPRLARETVMFAELAIAPRKRAAKKDES